MMRQWRESIKAPKTTADADDGTASIDLGDVCTLKSALVTMEEILHGYQEGEDPLDAHEEEERQLQVDMRADGWVFEKDFSPLVEASPADAATTDDDAAAAATAAGSSSSAGPVRRWDASIIGMRARRYFAGHGMSDGTIIAYLSLERAKAAAGSEGVEEDFDLWHMLHDDGDREDINLEQVQRAIKYCEEDADAPDSEDPQAIQEAAKKEDDDMSVASDAGEESSSDDDDGDCSGDEAGSRVTLWESAGARAKFIAGAVASSSAAEVALALSLFLENARIFGYVAQYDDVFDSPSDLAVWASPKRGGKKGRSSSKGKGRGRGGASKAGGNDGRGGGKSSKSEKRHPGRSNGKGVVEYSNAGRRVRGSRIAVDYREL